MSASQVTHAWLLCLLHVAVLFPRHFTPQTAPTTITHIQLFRDYLHYHIKCSKAYMHSRMRHRVAEFQKVLNRAKPEDKEVAAGGGRERKTVSYVQTVQCRSPVSLKKLKADVLLRAQRSHSKGKDVPIPLSDVGRDFSTFGRTS
jgi:hypothetical protein